MSDTKKTAPTVRALDRELRRAIKRVILNVNGASPNDYDAASTIKLLAEARSVLLSDS